jgi:hypothetical protein
MPLLDLHSSGIIFDLIGVDKPSWKLGKEHKQAP